MVIAIIVEAKKAIIEPIKVINRFCRFKNIFLSLQYFHNSKKSPYYSLLRSLINGVG